MIDTYQIQEVINTDAECPVIPVHDYRVDTIESEIATLKRVQHKASLDYECQRIPKTGGYVQVKRGKA
jgi:hypothetical protein